MTGTHASGFTPIYRQSAALMVAASAPVTFLMIVDHRSEYTSLPAIFLDVATWAIGLWPPRHRLFVEAETVGRQVFWRFVRGV